MGKPADIPQDVWDKAFDAMPPVIREAYETSPFSMVLHLGFARAILDAKIEERQACMSIVFGAYKSRNERCYEIIHAIRKRGEH